ncbi:hypothetical protein GUITHDRAFT_68201, partial [Guillardia theta CCMP2712]
IALGFGLSIAAGACTCVGFLAAFCVKLENRLVFAASLAASAGVMIFISLTEILTIKTVEGFKGAGQSDAEAMRYSILTFFAGAFICHLIDVFLEQGPVDGPLSLVLSEDRERAKELLRMGILSAVVILVHNIPEGVATFVSAVADPTAGVGVAFAIALHNIPEGLIVSVPIYLATGSKIKAFLWTAFSGAAEPFGALIAFTALKSSDMSPWAYAFIFGIVSGIMTYISLTELLPTALKYDPTDRVVKKSLFLGMFIIAISIILFEV